MKEGTLLNLFSRFGNGSTLGAALSLSVWLLRLAAKTVSKPAS